MWLGSGFGGARSRSPIDGAEQVGLVGRAGGVERDPAQLGGQRRRAVEVAAAVGEQLGEVGGGVAVAAVLEHPREQLIRRLLGAELDQLLLRGRQQQPRLELEQRGDQDQELGRRLEVELALLLDVLEVGDHDLTELDLGERDLLAQDDGHQQVERPREDVEVEVELRRLSCRLEPEVGRDRPAEPTPIASRTSASVGAAIARAFSAPAASTARARLVGAQLVVALAHRREVVDDGVGDRALEVAVARARELGLDRSGSTPRTTARISIRFEIPGLSARGRPRSRSR